MSVCAVFSNIFRISLACRFPLGAARRGISGEGDASGKIRDIGFRLFTDLIITISFLSEPYNLTSKEHGYMTASNFKY